MSTNQSKDYGPKRITYYGEPSVITAHVRYDDRCGNGHNTFAITGTITPVDKRHGGEAGGCLHEEIAKAFPELAPLIKWHLVSSDGPLHYIANTTYYAACGKFDYARESAVWPEATDEELTSPDLVQRLNDRLPKLMADFHAAVESLGFTW